MAAFWSIGLHVTAWVSRHLGQHRHVRLDRCAEHWRNVGLGEDFVRILIR